MSITLISRIAASSPLGLLKIFLAITVSITVWASDSVRFSLGWGHEKDSIKGSTLLSRPNSGVLPFIKKPDD